MTSHRSYLRTLCAAAALSAACAVPAAETLVPVRVEPRDTLIGLTRERLLDNAAWREVARLNRLRNPDRIRPGQVLLVPERLLRSLPVKATVIQTYGDVRAGDQPATPGTTLTEGQTLRTAEQTSAVVQLGDGSRVKLGPSTLAEIVAHREYATGSADAPASEGRFGGVLRLIQGSIEVFATKVLRARPLEVTTPTAVVGVRGTEFRVETDASRSRAEVLEGTVQAAALQGDAVALPAGTGTAIDAQTRKPVAQALLPAPDLSRVPQRFERPLVRIDLPDPDRTHRVQVASDADFDRIVADQSVPPGGPLRLAGLDDGTWHLRVRSVAADGLGGLDARHTFVLKARPEPPALITPAPGRKAAAGSVDIAWATNPAAGRYKLQVAPADGGFAAPLVERDGLDGSSLTLPALPAGRYAWRMASVKPDGDTGPWSDPQAFELRPLPEPPSGGLSGDGSRLTLAWGGQPGDRQQVELARDADFRQPVATAELEQPRWDLPSPEQPGTYYFRYRSVEPDGYVSPWSSTLQIEVPRNWRGMWPLLIPILLAL